MKQSIAIVIDAACDLPSDYIKQYDVYVIPTNVQFSGQYFADQRDEKETARFYQSYANNKTASIQSQPPSVEQIRSVLIDDIAEHYESALAMCVSSTRSELYKNTKQAALTVPKNLHDNEKYDGYPLKSIHVIDTHALFSGQAILAYAAVEVRKQNPEISAVDLADQISNLARSVYTFATTKDLFYARYRGRRRGEKAINIVIYLMAKLFDIKPIGLISEGKITRISNHRDYEKATEQLFHLAESAIHQGLQINAVTISYAGDLSDIEGSARYQAFKALSESRNIDVLLSMMGTTAGIYSGPGALTLSYCAA